jgi:hypothetical protein
MWDVALVKAIIKMKPLQLVYMQVQEDNCKQNLKQATANKR